MMIFRRLFSALILGVMIIVTTGASDGRETATVATSVSPGGGMENVKGVSGDDWSWMGRSKKMFDNVIKSAPFFVRSRVESKMRNEIKKRHLSVVAESDLYEVVRAVTPKLFIENALTAMEEARK